MPDDKNTAKITGGGNDIKTAVFWIVALLAVFWALGDRALGGSEGRWAEIARGMTLSGNWFHPFINDETYFDKPLLSYWLIAVLAKLSGVMNEWTARIPSGICAVAGLWATIRLGRTLWSPRTGRLAGWILLSTYGFLFWARKADADIENMSAIILAVAWFMERRNKLGFLTYFVFYLICALGAHTKGLPAIVIPAVALFPYLIRQKQWLRHVRISNFIALIIGAVIYLAPFIYAGMTRENSSAGEISMALTKSHESGLYMVFRENIERFFNPFDHKDPFYAYFIHLPRLFLPWSPLLALALVGAFGKYKKLTKETKWLLEAIVLIFIFFSASGSRRWYYILPILPFCAILTSYFLYSNWLEKWKRCFLVLMGMLFVLLASVELISPAFMPLASKLAKTALPPELFWSSTAIGLAALMPWIMKKRMPELLPKLTGLSSTLAPFAVSGFILMAGLFCVQYVELDEFRTEKPFALLLKKETADMKSSQIGFYPKVPTKLLFYLNKPGLVKVLSDKKEALDFLAGKRGVFLTQYKYLKYLPDALAEKLREEPDFTEKNYPWDKESKKFVGIKFGQAPEKKSVKPDEDKKIIKKKP